MSCTTTGVDESARRVKIDALAENGDPHASEQRYHACHAGGMRDRVVVGSWVGQAPAESEAESGANQVAAQPEEPVSDPDPEAEAEPEPEPVADAPSPRETAARQPGEGPRMEDQVQAEPEEEEEEEDRFRLFYLEISAGYVWSNLGVIKNENFVPDIQKIEGSGYGFGAGAGFFISFLTLGIQAEWARHGAFDLGTVTLDLGIRLPTPHLEPYLRAGIGYAWLSNLDNFQEEGDAAIRGVAVDIGLGFDYMISPLVAVGIGGDMSLFNVRRKGVSGRPTTDIVLEDDGDAIGIQVSALLQLNLHF